jgi:hypothetical protein
MIIIYKYLQQKVIQMNDYCEKIILAESLGVRLIYCKNCDVIELEIGAISVRLAPTHMQQVANIMMKASLKLDRMVNQQSTPNKGSNLQHVH